MAILNASTTTPSRKTRGTKPNTTKKVTASRANEELMSARPELSRWSGTRHNVALAECANVEERCGDTIVGHLTLLTFSPMYWLLVKLYRSDLKKKKTVLDSDPEGDLALFAARLFYAGVVAGRREGGQRDELGDLLFDAPWRPAPETPINPAKPGMGGGW